MISKGRSDGRDSSTLLSTAHVSRRCVRRSNVSRLNKALFRAIILVAGSALLLQCFTHKGGMIVDAQMCLETCDTVTPNNLCVQTNFTDCTVVCNNTGATTQVGTCLGTSFDDNSVVNCTDGACQSGTFRQSTVATCVGEASCNSANIWQSTIRCSGGSCSSGPLHVYTSVVSCTDYGTCADSLYATPCSCCQEDDGCSAGLPACAADILDFCSSTYLGQTCYEWGNPACENSNIAPTGNQVSICTDGACQNQAFVDTGVFCDNLSALDTCRSINTTSSLVDCNAGACQEAYFVESTVQCFTTIFDGTDASSSCREAIADRSTVACVSRSADASSYSSQQPGVCANAHFLSSAVTCANGACTDAWLARCSCCDGLGCEDAVGGATSCGSDTLQGFCSALYVGRTCKEWGNPICADVTVTTTTTNPLPLTLCALGDCQQGVYASAASIICDNKDYLGDAGTCEGIQVTSVGSTVACEAGACRNAAFTDATVECSMTQWVEQPSCKGASMVRSTVTCANYACNDVSFVSSAVWCSRDSACASSATFDDCSCCDGEGCNGSFYVYGDVELASCTSGNRTGFCTKCPDNPTCQNEDANDNGGSTDGTVPVPYPPTPAVPTPNGIVQPTGSGAGTGGNPVFLTTSPAIVSKPSPPSAGANGDATQPDVDATYFTTANTPVEIPPQATKNGQSMAVTVWPEHGTMTVKSDGTIVYTPNAGFDGTDRLVVQVCNSNTNECDERVMNVQVQALAASSKSSSFNALYLLSLLALLPIGAILFYKKTRRPQSETASKHETHYSFGPVANLGHDSGTSTLPPTTHPPHNGPAVHGPLPPQQQRQVAHSTNDSIDKHGLASLSSTNSSQQPPGRRANDAQDNPAANHGPSPAALAVMRGELPDNKDQCQSVHSNSNNRRGDAPPTTVLATAVPVDDHDVNDFKDMVSIETPNMNQ